jgi:hypothetical protein
MNRAQRSRPIQRVERPEISARDDTRILPGYHISPEVDIFTAGLLFNVLEDAYQRRRVIHE